MKPVKQKFYFDMSMRTALVDLLSEKEYEFLSLYFNHPDLCEGDYIATVIVEAKCFFDFCHNETEWETPKILSVVMTSRDPGSALSLDITHLVADNEYFEADVRDHADEVIGSELLGEFPFLDGTPFAPAWRSAYEYRPT